MIDFLNFISPYIYILLVVSSVLFGISLAIRFWAYNTIKNIKNENELVNSNTIAKLLGYDIFENYEEVAVYPRGYRILNKIPRMPSNIVTNLVKTFKSFQHILLADVDKLDEVEGIGEVRARTIKQSLRRMQEQFVFDNLMI